MPLLSEPFMTSRQSCPPVDDTHSATCPTGYHILNISEPALNLTSTPNTVNHIVGDSTFTDKNSTILNVRFAAQSMKEVISIRDTTSVMCYPSSTSNNQTPTPVELTLPQSETSQCKTKVKYVYLIVGLYAVIICILNVIMYCKSSVKLEVSKAEKKQDHTKRVSPALTILTYLLFVMFNFCFGGQEMTYSGLLFTFTTEHMDLSTIQGSLMVSCLFACYGAGRLGGMVVARYISPRALLLIDITCGAIAAFILAYFTTNNILAVWVCTVVGGLSLSTVFCSALIWARDFVPVSGCFTSAYVIAYTTGMMTWPPLTGFLVRERGPQWFPYINLALLMGCGLFYSLLVALKVGCKSKLKQPSLAIVTTNGHLQINRRLVFSSFHGSLPHLQSELKVL